MIKAKVGLIAGLVIFFSGCMNVQVTPSVVATQAKDINVNQQYKEGKACAQMYLGMGPFGDMSIQTAARSAGITKIAMVDYEVKMYVVYGNFCTVVKGE